MNHAWSRDSDGLDSVGTLQMPDFGTSVPADALCGDVAFGAPEQPAA